MKIIHGIGMREILRKRRRKGIERNTRDPRRKWEWSERKEE
jgi:hypothetical protein